jgi:hypothetical protein
MIAPQDQAVMDNVEKMVPEDILTSKNKNHVALVSDLRDEIHNDYEYSVRKSIGM